MSDIATGIPAETLFDAIRENDFTDVVAVPDTHVRTLITLLTETQDIRFIQTATEDEAVTLAAGLIIGGRKPLIQIQHAGLYACVNHLRGIGIDGQFPLVFMIGLLGRDPTKTPQDNFGSMVKYAEPLLQALDIPSYLIDTENDMPLFNEACMKAEAKNGPVAILIGEATV
ncbi:MAG: thiamine pyrophosphate-binding protein [Dehalococcoidia bacterium]|nr:thiamine pyrophosphate-binding protein [Dehalococcoidia bacterium]